MNTTKKIIKAAWELKPGEQFKFDGDRHWMTVAAIEVPARYGVAFGKFQRVKITTTNGAIVTPLWYTEIDKRPTQ